jgi:4-azaleucine resistance transporter AzlC
MKAVESASFLAGVKAILPILLGVFPFAIIAGITVVNNGIEPYAAMGMSLIIYAGASQLAMAELIGKQAPFLIILATALVINLRFLMYSAYMAPHFSGLKKRWTWPAAYMMTDQAFAVSVIGFTQNDGAHSKHWFYLGSGTIMWLTWQVGSLVGILAGLKVPASWGLDFAIPLTFMAILFPTLKDTAAISASVCAGIIALLALDLPFNTGILVAAGSGIGIGLLVETVKELHK